MLVAYEDSTLGFQIKEIPGEETRTGAGRVIENLAGAERILKRAKSERREVHWVISGNSPYRVKGGL